MEETLCEDVLVEDDVADVVDDVVDDVVVVVVVDLDQTIEVADTVIIKRKHNDNTKNYRRTFDHNTAKYYNIKCFQI